MASNWEALEDQLDALLNVLSNDLGTNILQVVFNPPQSDLIILNLNVVEPIIKYFNDEHPENIPLISTSRITLLVSKFDTSNETSDVQP